MPVRRSEASRSSRRGHLLSGIVLVAILALFPGGCLGRTGSSSSCVSCHKGIETASPNHRSCVSCHGGNANSRNEKESHRAMYGPRNPASPAFWEKTCGVCHPYQLARVRSNIMYTNTGMIRNIRLTWEGSGSKSWATGEYDVYDAAGNPWRLHSVAGSDDLSGELYRKFCSLCHIGIESGDVYSASHASGCAACHFPYNVTGTYEGNDPTVKGKRPYSASHVLAGLPDNKVCFRCHNRSGRISLSYEGLNDGNNSLVPTRNGFPGPLMISGARNLTHIPPDIHFEKGMDCIDCHTSRDVMGDGYAYGNMYLQTEIACEDCHGAADVPPRTERILRESDEAIRESLKYKMRMIPGMRMILTSKGRKYSNAFLSDNGVVVLGKRTGKIFRSKVITRTPEHAIVGHERMECYSCHSRTVVQCYGCHTKYDKTRMGRDFIKGVDTPGEFSETEDFRKLYPFPLAINQRGRISPVTPGCQTFVTVVDEKGTVEKDEYVARFKGRNQLRFAPFFSHNTGARAVGCGECHGNPAFLGFGQHVVERDGIVGTMLCEKSEEKPLDGFITLRSGKVRAFSAITREHSRPLNGKEIRRTLAANLCIVCHDKARDKDDIYQKRIDYRALDDPLHRRLLSVD